MYAKPPRFASSIAGKPRAKRNGSQSVPVSSSFFRIEEAKRGRFAYGRRYADTLPLPSLETVFAGADEYKDDHNAEHFDGARVLHEVLWMLSEG